MKSRIWEKEKGKYANILDKIQVTAIFLWKICIETLYFNLQRVYAGADLDAFSMSWKAGRVLNYQQNFDFFFLKQC